MELALAFVAVVTIFLVMIWYYESKLDQVTVHLNELLDKLDAFLDDEPPFNLETWHPQPQPKLALVSDRVFSQLEIEEWN